MYSDVQMNKGGTTEGYAFVLYSGDGHSIPMIFNNLVGKNLKGREYSDYIAFVAIPDMGFTYGKIEYYSDGNLIATGEITP